jgi:hypothetical protein
MKRLIKRTLLAAAPELMTGLLSARAWAHSHRMARKWGLNSLTEKLVAALGPVVRSGPFRGMTLTPMTHLEHLGPFLLGTYEFELHPWFASVAGHRYAQILDIGAKFGYYAVGLARSFPDTPMVAFDTDWWARAACREMAVANRSPNVAVAGFCSSRWLDQNLRPASLIVCDCEGFEGDLLTRSASSALGSATLIVETHDEMNPGVTDVIRGHFAATHRIATVSADPAIGPNPPIDLSFLTVEEACSAVREVRGRQTWLFPIPKDDGHRSQAQPRMGWPQGVPLSGRKPANEPPLADARPGD